MKVTVLTLTYNHAAYIRQSLESALAQKTTFDFEIVVGDDGSRDETTAIVKQCQAAYPGKIRLLCSDRNMGLHSNVKRTLAACGGEYLAVLDGDDYWTSPTKLQRQVDLLDTHRDWVLCFHRVTIIDEDTGTEYDLGPMVPREFYTFEDILCEDFIPTSSVVARQSMVKEKPQWEETLPFEDWSTWIVWAAQGNLGYLDETLGVYRRHGSGIWSGLPLTEQLTAFKKLYRLVNEHFGFKHDRLIKALSQRVDQQLSSALLFASKDDEITQLWATTRTLGAQAEECVELNARVKELGAQAEERVALNARVKELGAQSEERVELYARIQHLSNEQAELARTVRALGDERRRLFATIRELSLVEERSELDARLQQLANEPLPPDLPRGMLAPTDAHRSEEPAPKTERQPPPAPRLNDASLDRAERQLEYGEIVQRTRALVCKTVPPDATVIVLSKGDTGLLDLGGRRAWHFPPGPDGGCAWSYPATGQDAVSQLEDLLRKGGSFLIVPSSAYWWLDHYAELRQYLDRHGAVVAQDSPACLVISLTPVASCSNERHEVPV